VRSYLEAGRKGEVPETPKPNDPIFSNSYTALVGNNLWALEAAAERAQMLGYRTLILSSMIEGDTTEAAGFHSALLKEIVRSGHPVGPPACLISGGETTVLVRGRGKGGRNMEFPRHFLAENDSYHFFEHLEDLVITGPTNTNVMDLRVMLVNPNAANPNR
jgi:glycerate 2-kinase